MPDYTQPASDDTPCLDLLANQTERTWLALHLGHSVQLTRDNGDLYLECLTCDCYLVWVEAVDADDLVECPNCTGLGAVGCPLCHGLVPKGMVPKSLADEWNEDDEETPDDDQPAAMLGPDLPTPDDLPPAIEDVDLYAIIESVDEMQAAFDALREHGDIH